MIKTPYYWRVSWVIEIFWLDGHSANFVSQEHFWQRFSGLGRKHLNEEHNGKQYFGKTWQPLWQDSTNQTYTNNGFILRDKNFAHTVDNSQFMSTPWDNQMIIDFAREAINQESLGQHDTTDMIGINFSSFEDVSKTYGDYSPESLDLVLRFDQSLSDFFAVFG